ncbi:Tn3 family transposase [Microcoleus sp. herbarium8]|uniref:Tn3 family transposase n=1 Tax=Microcoleus sp. herbarium8 TaxID=3055436 RepID=UPI002FD0E4AB
MPEQRAFPTQKRLQILGDEEIANFYGLPQFTPEEQSEYFALSPRETAALDQLHSIKSRIYGILQLGYFKARHLFFIFNFSSVVADAQHIQARYFPKFPLTEFELTKVTRLKHQRLILELCSYRVCDEANRQALMNKAQQAARVSGKPIYILRELMHYLEEQRIVAPGYSFMQDVVAQSLVFEQDRLISVVKRGLTTTDTEALNQLIEDGSGLYEITQMKREPKDFSLGEIKREISRSNQIQPLYHLAQTLLPTLEISRESIKYYASLVTYYSVFRLKQLSQSIVHVYLLCFVYHRYQRAHDNLINSLIYNVRRYVEESKVVAKEMVYEYQVDSNQNLQKAGQILKLFTDDSIAETTSFQTVRTRAFEILERQKLAFLAEHIATQATFDETTFQWAQVDRLARQFKCNLRIILQAIEFASTSEQAPLLKALQFLKAAIHKGRPLSQYRSDSFPTQFIPDSTRRYLYASAAGGQLLPDRYEFLVYRLLRNGLEAGDIFCRDSVRFRSFEDDLLSEQQWKAKTELMTTTGLTILKQPIQDYLTALEQTLEKRLNEVNQRLIAGENQHFEVKKRGSQVRWTLHSPGIRESINHPLFNALKQVNLSSVLHFVNQRCQFSAAFEHLLGRYAKQKSDDSVLIACLIAWGTNMGLGRMGETSDISYHSLVNASDNVLRPETLKQANDQVSNAIAKLPIFQHYDIGGELHSSSDGQKFESQIQTINARHSPKYFGLKKGVVSYTLVANHVPVNAKIIGANEHESHYVFDLLFNNTTEVQPTVHSTDTHGANEVNFAILHLFGYQFAPRYRDIHDKVSHALYGFKHPSQYEAALLKPIRKINTNLILSEWDNIQRIMVSLALKTTTQSIIVSKLSAYARKNKTRRALWEYDNIIKSLYLLDYVDSVPLRQNVQRALNRGESYHQLRRAVSYANFGKLRFKTEYEQQIWGDCARLLTNCVIYYNAAILSDLLTHSDSSGDLDRGASLSQVSPVAWQHINFYGRYEFNRQPELIDMQAILQQLMKLPLE